mgnify:CR=1 FL=1
MGESDAEVTFGTPTKGDVYLVDFQAPSPAPQQLYPETCRSQLSELNLMPMFLNAGEEIVFTSRPSSDALSGSLNVQFFRMRTQDAGASECPIEPFIPPQQLKDAGTEADPRFYVSGAGLAGSRSYPADTGCSCKEGRGPAWWVVLMGPWWLWRRRSSRTYAQR